MCTITPIQGAKLRHAQIRYFDFHAAPTTTEPPVSPETHGVIPVWGFGMVEASTHPDIKVGERVYGYFAPTRYLLLPIATTEVSAYSCFVPRPHLPAGEIVPLSVFALQR